MPPTVLCVATYEKGQEYIRETKRLGCRVLLLTDETLRDADWPRESIDNTFYVPRDTISRDDLIKGVSHLAQTEQIDRIVPLDDFDVELAALLREHLRVPGMGETTARYFRDKLAMRVKARDQGILVPDFVHLLNRDAIRRYVERVPPPWLVKPRSQAASVGIRKVESADDLARVGQELGDQQSFYLVERYLPGDIFHVDAVVSERKVVFAAVHQYGTPPWNVAHQGGIFSTRTLPDDSVATELLESLNREVVSTLGLVRGVTHTEFIRAQDDGRFYFLETSARVGGAYIVDVVEAGRGVNLWREWARIEVAGEDGNYTPPEVHHGYAGIVLSLARQEWPDTSAYRDPEIVSRVRRRHHAGLIVASSDPYRVEHLLDEYQRRFLEDFYAFEPAPDKPIG